MPGIVNLLQLKILLELNIQKQWNVQIFDKIGMFLQLIRHHIKSKNYFLQFCMLMVSSHENKQFQYIFNWETKEIIMPKKVWNMKYEIFINLKNTIQNTIL